MPHLIGAYGQYWNRDLVDWGTRGWQLLGRGDYTDGTVQAVDFRHARGIYILYSDVGVEYVGLAGGKEGIGGRLINHTRDRHESSWTRFSFYTFDEVAQTPRADGIYGVDTHGAIEMSDKVAIRELEALMQVVLVPRGNLNRTQFSIGEEWLQLPTIQPDLEILAHVRNRLYRVD